MIRCLLVFFFLAASLAGAQPVMSLTMTKITGSDLKGGEYFGESVDISGNYAVVGAEYDDDNGAHSGSAYVFERVGTRWSQQAKMTASDGVAEDRFGYSIGIAGDYVIVGAYGDDGFRGAAYVFHRDGTRWNQQTKLRAGDGVADDLFGLSAAISGAYAIVGASNDESGRGAAYVFRRDGGSWIQQAKLTADDGAADDLFGIKVALSGDDAVVGAGGSGSGRGAVYVFQRTGTAWIQEAKLMADDGAAGDNFGFGVSISGEYVAVGAYADDGYAGSAYVFKRDGGKWTQEAKLTAPDREANDWFGHSVAVSGDWIIVGAERVDERFGGGAIYLFKREGSLWPLHAKLIPYDGGVLGASVAISGGYAITGGGFKNAAYIIVPDDADPSGCTAIDGSLNLPIPCLEYGGTNVDLPIVLERYANPADPSGLYWRLKLGK